MIPFAEGGRIAIERLNGRFAAVAGLVSATFVVLAAVLERRDALPRAADNALLGAAFGVTIPVIAYAMVTRVCEAGRFQDAVEPIARHGLDRRVVNSGLLLVGAVLASGFGAVIAVTALMVAGGVAGNAADVATSAWIGGLGGSAYFAFFCAGACFGKRGGGRWLLLAVDWALGTTTTVAALPWPRGHLRNLLGAEPVANMAQSQASLTLALIALLGVVVALLRTPR